jgi:hypothetical protein
MTARLLIFALLCIATVPIAAERCSAQSVAGDSADPVERECRQECTVFRKKCQEHCQERGEIPGSNAPVDDCQSGCSGFEQDCLDNCTRMGLGVRTLPGALGR